jgi:hypothetical protein
MDEYRHSVERDLPEGARASALADWHYNYEAGITTTTTRGHRMIPGFAVLNFSVTPTVTRRPFSLSFSAPSMTGGSS